MEKRCRAISVKLKIAIWYLLFMCSMAGLVLVSVLLASDSVVRSSAMDQLSQTVRSNLLEVDVQDDGALQIGEGFTYYQNGVYTLIYSQEEALLAGQVPVSFTATEPFENGVTRLVSTEQDDYYVLDLWYAKGWDAGVWVRGLMEAPQPDQTIQNLLSLAAVVIPAFILLAALGGYWIVKRAFRPLEEITATAQAISEGADLAARIERRRGSSEFTRLTDAFNQMFERLEQSFEAEKRFTADASHELRTPVSIIKGACEYAEKFDESPEERAETMAMIYRQALRMSGLITQLLSMTRLDQGTEGAALEEMDLSALVRTICSDQACPPERLSVEVEDGLTIQGSAPLLTQLLQNLIDNGFKYGRQDGQVWVSARREGDEIQLSVRDNGIGIAKEQQDKIWQRFYQVDPARANASGAGLGLSMVQKIAQAHGGYMTVDSVPNLGSQFVLHLPGKENSKKSEN